jgi:hypothetical protein
LAVVTTPAWGDVAVVGAIAGVASLLALVPAWLAYRQGVADGLRG